jgi:hypothetical protein
MTKQLAFAFTDSNWHEQPLYVLDDGHMEHCDQHGDFCPNAYYDQLEVSRMIADGFIDCPLCLAEIVGING